MTAGEQTNDDAELIIKRSSAANLNDLRLIMPLDSTVAEFKARLQGLYEDRPEPACVAVIHAGHVLKDDNRKLRDILNVAMGNPHSLHVVVRDRPCPSPAAALPQQQLRVPAVQPRPSPAVPPPAPTPTPPVPAPSPASNSAQALSTPHSSFSGASTAPPGASASTRSPASAPLAMPTATIAAPAPSGPAALGLSPAPSMHAARRLPDSSQPQPALPTSPSSRPAPSNAGLVSGTDGLPPPQIPPNLAGNPAMAAAFRAAFEALTSPTAIHNLTVPQPQGTQLPQPMHLGGSLLFQPHPLPHLQPFFPQPITYMPALGLVQPPPGPDGQQAQPRYTPVLAPVVPMMMPYGMMPYAPPAAVQFSMQQPEPMQYPAQAPPMPPAQANNPINNYFAGFPGLGFPGLQPAGGAAAAAAAGGVAAAVGGNAGGRQRNGRAPQIRVRLIQINLRALLQLAVMGVILYQHCPPGRFLLFASVGLALYVMGPAPLRRAWHRLLAMLPPMHGPGHAAGPVHDAFDAGGGAGNVAQQGNGNAAGQNGGVLAGVGAGAGVRVNPAGQPPVRGFLQEVQALVVGFFTSLLPGWNINPEDAAAFAAAQQAANANEARAAAGLGDNREHFD